MKKQLFFLPVLLLAVLTLFSCSKNDDDNSSSSSAYITAKDLAGTWTATHSAGTITIDIRADGAFTETIVSQYPGSEPVTTTQNGHYSLSRAEEHYIGISYKQVVVNDDFDYKPFRWLNTAKTSFNFNDYDFTKQ